MAKKECDTFCLQMIEQVKNVLFEQLYWGLLNKAGIFIEENWTLVEVDFGHISCLRSHYNMFQLGISERHDFFNKNSNLIFFFSFKCTCPKTKVSKIWYGLVVHLLT